MATKLTYKKGLQIKKKPVYQLNSEIEGKIKDYLDLSDYFEKALIINESTQELLRIKEILGDTTKELKFDDRFFITNQGKAFLLGNDSKIVSKIYELIIIDTLKTKLAAIGLEFTENHVQNKYPDFIIKSKVSPEKYYAVDIKSSYLKNQNSINGFTLGTYKGYFRNRTSLKSIVYPYEKFLKHFCLCVIYDRVDNKIPVKHVILQEKWKLASNSTGSGNTTNIGSIKSLKNLLAGKSHFTDQNSFDQYWLNKS